LTFEFLFGLMVYLDYAATTPVAREVLRLMQPYFSKKFGNPSSAHQLGQEAFRAISHSRDIVGKACGISREGVVFTASATEANNLALRGTVRGITNYQLPITKPHIITTAIEHDSVLEVCRELEREGLAEVTYVGVSSEGVVDSQDIKKALRPETVLVSVMYANNEIGTIQPISEIAKIIRNFRKPNYPLFHTDAVQAVQFLDCNLERLGVDLMTISSHKIYGPKGAAALLIRNSDLSEMVKPILVGGGQESGLRSGTENVPAIVGFAKALELAVKNRQKESKRLTELRDYFIEKLTQLGAIPNGSWKFRLPNNVNVSFPGMSSDALLTLLDRAGIAASSGSACAAHASKPSHVLLALGIPEERRKSAVRFSLGKFTKKSDLDYVLETIAKYI
jgi:cysteine desulfurase